MKVAVARVFSILLICSLFTQCKLVEFDNENISFIVTADMRNYTGDNKDYFRGACEAIQELQGIQFIISPGDIDPPDSVLYTMQKYINNQVVWYPLVGNHEAETVSDMEWLRAYNKHGNVLPKIVNQGPMAAKETTYSFDYGNTHFVILNQYSNDTCDNCTNGNVSDALYNWLESDLKKNKKKKVLVFGHEPAYPLPDMETQRFRHFDDALNQDPTNRDRFVRLMESYNVIAYIFGHTHNYSVAKINKIWHMDVAHSRGLGDQGARSTFIKMDVRKGKVSYQTYRLNYQSGKYEIADSGNLN